MKNYLLSIFIGFFLFFSLAPSFVHALPSSLDTDGDGLPDAQEDVNQNGKVDLGESDPLNADTDDGGESDGSEVKSGRSPLDSKDDLTADSDGDGLATGIELMLNTDPNNPDTDGDGINDKDDPFPLDPRYQTDINSNQLPDEWEERYGVLKSQATPSRVDDLDNDGLTNAEEFARGTNPVESDTDRDGVDDKTEINEGTDPKEIACLSYAPVVDSFQDTVKHWAEERIRKIRSISILPTNTPLIRGYEQKGKTLFAPDQPVLRYEFLKMVVLSTCTKLWNTPLHSKVTFSDVHSTSVINENDDTALKRRIIYSAVRYDIIGGYADGTFRADEKINRAEAIKILFQAAKLNFFDPSLSANVSSSVFTDVTPGDWFAPYVQTARKLGIIEGYKDGSFGPERPITRAEAVKIIEETMLRNPSINGYVLAE